MLPDLERAERIGEFWSYPQSRTFAELLIDCEEDKVLRAVLVGMLREAKRGAPPSEEGGAVAVVEVREVDGPRGGKYFFVDLSDGRAVSVSRISQEAPVRKRFGTASIAAVKPPESAAIVVVTVPGAGDPVSSPIGSFEPCPAPTRNLSASSVFFASTATLASST
jgi:hypothetical protein